MGKEKENENVVTLTDNKTVTTQPSTTVTSQEPRTTVQTTQRSLSPAMQEENRKQAAELSQSYQVDPATGQYTGRVGDLLGFDPDRFKEDEEAKQRLERFKQKEAGWKNALGILTDVATAAAGGNVYERKADDSAAKAATAAEKAKDNVMKLGTTVANAKNARVRAWEEAERKRQSEFLNKYMQSQTSSHTVGGEKVVNKTGGQVSTYSTDQQQKRGGDGSNGNKKKWVIDVNPMGGAESPQIMEISEADYNIVANRLEIAYRRILEGKDPATGQPSVRAKNSREKLISQGVLKRGEKGGYVIDKDLLMAHGHMYDLPDDDRRFIEQMTDGRIKFTGNRITVSEGQQSGGDDTFGVVDNQQGGEYEDEFDF